jgi:hypothetical protein
VLTPSSGDDVDFCVVAIFGCHLKEKGNKVSQHVLLGKRSRGGVLITAEKSVHYSADRILSPMHHIQGCDRNQTLLLPNSVCSKMPKTQFFRLSIRPLPSSRENFTLFHELSAKIINTLQKIVIYTFGTDRVFTRSGSFSQQRKNVGIIPDEGGRLGVIPGHVCSRRATKTEHEACRTTRSAVLPSKNRVNAAVAVLPTTIKSGALTAASFRISSWGMPIRTLGVGCTCRLKFFTYGF